MISQCEKKTELESHGSKFKFRPYNLAITVHFIFFCVSGLIFLTDDGNNNAFFIPYVVKSVTGIGQGEERFLPHSDSGAQAMKTLTF